MNYLIIPGLREFIDLQCRALGRAPPKRSHVTFCYYGRSTPWMGLIAQGKVATPCRAIRAFKEEIYNHLKNMSEGERTVTVSNYEVFNTRRGKLLVAKIIVSEQISNLRKMIYDKYNIKDHIVDYNPHVTLGAPGILFASGLFPKIPKNKFIITGLEFH